MPYLDLFEALLKYFLPRKAGRRRFEESYASSWSLRARQVHLEVPFPVSAKDACVVSVVLPVGHGQ